MTLPKWVLWLFYQFIWLIARVIHALDPMGWMYSKRKRRPPSFRSLCNSAFLFYNDRIEEQELIQLLNQHGYDHGIVKPLILYYRFFSCEKRLTCNVQDLDDNTLRDAWGWLICTNKTLSIQEQELKMSEIVSSLNYQYWKLNCPKGNWYMASDAEKFFLFLLMIPAFLYLGLYCLYLLCTFILSDLIPGLGACLKHLNYKREDDDADQERENVIVKVIEQLK